MNTKLAQVIFTTTTFLLSAAFSSNSYAEALTIDDFSHYQLLTDKGNTEGGASNTIYGLTGTDLINASRTFSAEATMGGGSSRVDIVSGIYSPEAESYLLNISNSNPSSGNASIVWNFNPINFTTYGSAILLDVFDIDLDVKVEMVANDIARSGFKTFSNAGDFLLSFNDFSNSEVFTNVTSFRLDFEGPLAWDGQFKLLTTGAPVTSVPVPSALYLMGTALMGMIGVSRKKQTSMSNC